MKICPVGAKLLHVNRQTARQTYVHDKAIIAFGNFANVPKTK